VGTRPATPAVPTNSPATAHAMPFPSQGERPSFSVLFPYVPSAAVLLATLLLSTISGKAFIQLLVGLGASMAIFLLYSLPARAERDEQKER